jgi:hypothetical protein
MTALWGCVSSSIRSTKSWLVQVDGQLTNESLRELYRLSGERVTATDPSAAIVDFSAVTEFVVSSHVFRELAREQPLMPDESRPRFIVTPQVHAFGLGRMFQLVGEHSRPNLKVVRSLGEALQALHVKSPQFEPLD